VLGFAIAAFATAAAVPSWELLAKPLPALAGRDVTALAASDQFLFVASRDPLRFERLELNGSTLTSLTEGLTSKTKAIRHIWVDEPTRELWLDTESEDGYDCYGYDGLFRRRHSGSTDDEPERYLLLRSRQTVAFSRDFKTSITAMTWDERGAIAGFFYGPIVVRTNGRRKGRRVFPLDRRERLWTYAVAASSKTFFAGTDHGLVVVRRSDLDVREYQSPAAAAHEIPALAVGGATLYLTGWPAGGKGVLAVPTAAFESKSQ
jgi:hypothetical protein